MPTPKFSEEETSAAALRWHLDALVAEAGAASRNARFKAIVQWGQKAQGLPLEKRISVAVAALTRWANDDDRESFFALLFAAQTGLSAFHKSEAMTAGLTVAAGALNDSLCERLLQNGAKCEAAAWFSGRRDPLAAMIMSLSPKKSERAVRAPVEQIERLAQMLSSATDHSKSEEAANPLLRLAIAPSISPLGDNVAAELAVARVLARDAPQLLAQKTRKGLSPLGVALLAKKNELANFFASRLLESEVAAQAERALSPECGPSEEAKRSIPRWRAEWESARIKEALLRARIEIDPTAPGQNAAAKKGVARL